ncbi:uncharacterized protein LOC105702776 [Orussus abietinus]|uniref:uncharacterized protein LOC105702776 n=1 Tax=Orussus abietinus TaxID=222816 RepID=UPI0006251E50|nr:uncharacterized protein LOC105702776 [Orussus abietinus]
MYSLKCQLFNSRETRGFRLRAWFFSTLILLLSYRCAAQNSVAFPNLQRNQAQSVNVICPTKEKLGLFERLLPLPCNQNSDCTILGAAALCCERRCTQGVAAPPREPQHNAVLGVIDRICPTKPMPEALPVKRCAQDTDCERGRRICCPDLKDKQLYCRTAAPNWTQLPFQRTHSRLMTLLEYMQCQTPGPSVLDLLIKPCNSTSDCFPQLCCQEGAYKVCRPARKSWITLIAQTTQVISYWENMDFYLNISYPKVLKLSKENQY